VQVQTKHQNQRETESHISKTALVEALRRTQNARGFAFGFGSALGVALGFALRHLSEAKKSLCLTA
jgi:hypothetical protein